MAQQPISGLDRLTVEVSRSQTIRHKHTLGRTPLNEWSARRRGCYLHHTHYTQQTNIQALNGVQTRRPSNQEAAGLLLDHMATGIGQTDCTILLNFNLPDYERI